MFTLTKGRELLDSSLLYDLERIIDKFAQNLRTAEKISPLYKKVVFYTALGILSAMMLVTCIERGNGDPSAPKNVMVRNHQDGGFFANISIINHLIHTCEQSKKKLMILLNSGLYEEDRSHFIVDNPYTTTSMIG